MSSENDERDIEGNGTKKPFLSQDQILYLIVIIISSLIYFVGTFKYGMGLSTDSVKYFSAAESIAKGGGFEIYNGDLYYQYSPLTPLFLSIFPLLGIDTLSGARLFFMAVFILNNVFSLFIINMVVKNRFLRISGMVLLLFSLSIYRVSIMLYSEPLFILLTQASFIFLYKYLKDRRNHQLVFLITFSALACLCRYIGVVLILTVALSLLVALKGDLIRKVSVIMIYGISSAIPTLVFVGRNYYLTDTLLGERYASNYGLFDNLLFVSRTVTEWFIPDFLNMDFFIFIYGVLIFVSLIMTLKNRREIKTLIMKNSMLLIFISYAIVYILYLTISASRVGFDTLNNRFLSPVNIPILLSIVIGIDLFWSYSRKSTSSGGNGIVKGWKRYAAYAFVGILVLMALSQITLTGLRTNRNFNNGSGGYNVDTFHDSEILAYLDDNPLDGNLFTNGPEAYYLFLDVKDTDLTPRKTYQATYEIADELPEFNSSLSSLHDNYIVWFDIVNRSYLYDIDELVSLYDMTIIMEFQDGRIYRLD